jgi:hypothetical protein
LQPKVPFGVLDVFDDGAGPESGRSEEAAIEQPDLPSAQVVSSSPIVVEHRLRSFGQIPVIGARSPDLIRMIEVATEDVGIRGRQPAAEGSHLEVVFGFVEK